MAVSTLLVPNQPYVNENQIIDVLTRDIPKAWNIPIFVDFPSQNEKVRYGIYVSDVHTDHRNPHQLAVQYCGTIYHAYDEFMVTYISYQEDPYNNPVNAIIANLVTAIKDDGEQLMNGYFQRDFDQVRTYGPTQAEKHVWTFSLLRMEFNT
tara:strand:+ start:38 stop:490 length:453 start_codon:yes stop_codon:yes gene_type:complete